jgi:hypothetical protein
VNWIFLGALGGALAVVSGAFGAHALAARLDPRSLELWETASRYLMYGSLALVLVGLYGQPGARRIDSAGWCLLAGTLKIRHADRRHAHDRRLPPLRLGRPPLIPSPRLPRPREVHP